MPDKILFQQDRLTITETHLIVGRARVTVFFPSISTVSIYEGRPLLPVAVMSLVGLVPTLFFIFMGARIFGPYFPTKTVAFMLLPFLAIAAAGFFYRVKCLFVTIDGQSVAVLKSKDIADLERAKAALEQAKAASENRARA